MSTQCDEPPKPVPIPAPRLSLQQPPKPAPTPAPRLSLLQQQSSTAQTVNPESTPTPGTSMCVTVATIPTSNRFSGLQVEDCTMPNNILTIISKSVSNQEIQTCVKA